MTLEEEKRFLLLLASYYQSSHGIVPTREKILTGIQQRNWAMLSGKDLQIAEGESEETWKVELSQAARKLAESGLYENDSEVSWGITDAGKEELYRMHELLVSSFPMKLTSSAVEYAEEAFPFA